MTRKPNKTALRGRVAVVAGATRGAGRGIVAALGEAGATVIYTSRTTKNQRSEYNRPLTIFALGPRALRRILRGYRPVFALSIDGPGAVLGGTSATIPLA